jgi:hypothetical protein
MQIYLSRCDTGSWRLHLNLDFYEGEDVDGNLQDCNAVWTISRWVQRPRHDSGG